MKILLLDDEKPALSVLEKAVKGAMPESETIPFSVPENALEYMKENPVDIVFCDYVMPKMNGIEFGKQVKKILPKADLVFVTGYDEYAVEAINTVAPQGYIVKPVSKGKIEKVLGNLHTDGVKKGLYVATFGNFNVFFDGEPVEFKNKKAKELFAFLIDRMGPCTRRELTSVLYENREESNAVRYLTEAVKCLSDTLKSYGAGEVFLRRFNSYSIDSKRLSCDLYEYMNGNLNLFRGEYMEQYSWGEYSRDKFS